MRGLFYSYPSIYCIRSLQDQIHYLIVGTLSSVTYLKAAYSVTVNIFEKIYFLFKSFVKVELSYVFTIKNVQYS